MNILIWSPFLQKVGTTTNVYNLINSIKKYSKKERYEIDLINVFGEWDDYIFDKFTVNKISLLNFDFLKKAKKNGFIRSRLYTFFIIIFSIVPLIKLLQKKKYNFFFIHLITSLPIFLAGFLKKNTKIILNISGFPKLTFIRTLFWKNFQNNIFKIICPSYETKDLLIKKKIFNENKLMVIKDPHINPRDIIVNRNNIKKQNLNFDNRIIAIGRLTKQKNYIFLLQAFKKILSFKKDLKLIIIGEGEDRKSIEKQIQDLEIKDCVSLKGYQKNIYKYLENSLCYFSTSLWEGPDLAMLDAAFLNVPIICSDCQSGRKEFIKENKRGYIFKTNDMSSAIKAFEIFFNDKKNEVEKKLINAKKEIKNFTPFRYYLDIKKILNN